VNPYKKTLENLRAVNALMADEYDRLNREERDEYVAYYMKDIIKENML